MRTGRMHCHKGKVGIVSGGRCRYCCSFLNGRTQHSGVGAVDWGGGLHSGLSKRNLDLLNGVAQLIASIDGPWVVGGELRASGWHDIVNSTIHASAATTCNGRVTDFFVASRCLDEAIYGVAIIGDAGVFPHSLVWLWIRAAARSH